MSPFEQMQADVRVGRARARAIAGYSGNAAVVKHIRDIEADLARVKRLHRLGSYSPGLGEHERTLAARLAGAKAELRSQSRATPVVRLSAPVVSLRGCR